MSFYTYSEIFRKEEDKKVSNFKQFRKTERLQPPFVAAHLYFKVVAAIAYTAAHPLKHLCGLCSGVACYFLFELRRMLFSRILCADV